MIGGGYGGATAAKYIRMWSEGRVEVFLIERNTQFVSCPLSNLVLGGSRTIESLTLGYDKLREYGVQVIRDEVTGINPERKRVQLRRIEDLPFDRLIVSPGVDFLWNEIPGLNNADAQKVILHAWKAGPDTVALRKQLEAMPDGGTYVMSIPKAPYRCPPGPYERASQVAAYFKQAKPKSKVLVLDGNEDIVSKKGLFLAAWNDLYKGMIDYRPNQEVKDVDVKGMALKTDFDSFKGNVLNVIPPQRAGDIAAAGEAHHRQQPLVRRQLADHGIGGGARRVRARRRDALGVRDAQVREHGQQPRQDRRERDRRVDDRPRTHACAADLEHVLQLRERDRGDARQRGLQVRPRQEDHAAGAGRRRGVEREVCAREGVRGRLGDQHLGRFAGLIRSAGSTSARPPRGGLFHSGLGDQPLPVLPNPPAPRSDATNCSTTLSATCCTGMITSCATRSSGCSE